MSSASNTPNLAFYLPYGELLRTFLDQGYITMAEIRHVLRQRGVFLSDYDKAKSIPYLAFTTVSPKEFEFLLEMQKQREDSPKSIIETIDWTSDSTLSDAVPSAIDLVNLIGKNQTSKIVYNSGVQMVDNDPNHIRVEFDLERPNLHKSWSTDMSPHRGAVELRRVVNGSEATVEIISTVPETRTLGKKIVSNITDGLKLRGHVPVSSRVKKVHFGSFGNATRVKFLLDFTDAKSTELKFKAMTDGYLVADKTTKLPNEIKLFFNEIDGMGIEGKQLQNSMLLKDPEYHEYVILSSITIDYSFEYHAAKGTCSVCYGFIGYPKGKGGHDFETNIKNISFDSTPENRKAARKYVENLITALARDRSRPFASEVIT